MSIANKLTKIAENMINVFERGKTEGYNEGYEAGKAEVTDGGYDEGFEAGKQAEYTAFWDEFFEQGYRKIFFGAFFGHSWSEKNMRPNRDMICEGSISNIFRENRFRGSIKQRFAELGIRFNTSGATTSSYDCTSSVYVTEFPDFDFTSITNANNTFAGCVKLESQVITVSDKTAFSNTFRNCTSLANLTVNGTVGKSIDLSQCPLTLESAKSVIEHLKNFRDTANENTYSVTFSDYTWMLLDADGKHNHGVIEGTWREYLTYLCWNF